MPLARLQVVIVSFASSARISLSLDGQAHTSIVVNSKMCELNNV